MIPLPNTANRLALGLMAVRGCKYEEAVATLQNLTLHLVCDSAVARSAALQAALLTALNCGGRAFLGGVRVSMPENTPLLLPWPGQDTLNCVVGELLGSKLPSGEEPSQTLYFGFEPVDPQPDSLTVWATGWRGGVEPAGTSGVKFEMESDAKFALGGIFAGAVAVHRAFLRCAGISLFACAEGAGLSLWDQAGDWHLSSSEGPPLRALPSRLWLLGLGHLGQAFLWTVGLLPFADPGQVALLLQDYDSLEDANIGSGLLSGEMDIGQQKARVCAKWLEERGFNTTICERAFDDRTWRQPGEPAIALCGFDKPEPRRLLESANFKLVIECGLGGNINDFDLIHLHVFPGRHSAAELWKGASAGVARPQQRVVDALTPAGEVCGALALDVAGKSVSTSFVGAMASAAVFGELLRAYHKGQRHDEIYLSPRNMTDCSFATSPGVYKASEIAELGFCDIKKCES